MSPQNVDVVRQFIEAARSGDHAIEAFIAVSDPSLEHTRLPAASGPETYSGHGGVRRWFTDMADLWREWRNEIEFAVRVRDPHGGRAGALHRRRKGQRCPGRGPARIGVRVVRGEGLAKPHVRERRGRPRSRGAVGVADVAGERRDRPCCLWRVQRA